MEKTLARKAQKNPNLEELIQFAVKYAKEAYNLLNGLDVSQLTNIESDYLKIVKTYALNMYLYHSVEEDRLYRKRDLIDLANSLAKLENNDHVWQYRFDDTLAVCYAKLALLVNKDLSQKEFYFKLADSHIKKAIDHIDRVYGNIAFEGRDKDVRQHEKDIDLLKNLHLKRKE